MESGEVFCPNCGLVVDEHGLDMGPEWRCFDGDEDGRDRVRVGLPVTLVIYDKGLRTAIGLGAVREKLGPERLRQFERLKKMFETRADSQVERALQAIGPMLEGMCDRLHLPRAVLEHAASLVRQACRRRVVQGRSYEDLATAALFIACRVHGLPVTLTDILSARGLDTAVMDVRTLVQLKKRVNHAIRRVFLDTGLVKDIPLPDPRAFIQKIVDKLRLPSEITAIALEVFRRARRERVFQGKSPVGCCAACVFVACQMRPDLLDGRQITQRDVAVAAGVTEVTLRKRREEIMKVLGGDGPWRQGQLTW